MNTVCKREEVAQASLVLLRQQTKEEIAVRLDSRKILLAESKYHRDWRGLAEYVNVDPSTIRCSKISCTQHCLYLWIQKGGGLIKDLWKALECIDRYDIIEDTQQYIYDDFDYALSRDVLHLRPIAPPPDSIIPTIADFDANVLTTDDQQNILDGGTLQFYDALVLYVDEDLDFVDEMVQKLEGEYNLKLCLKDRDLVGGLSFEFSAVMRLIEERCARVIVVLSPAFLNSNANKFLTQFAHAHSIDQQRRIVIPCMVKPCKKPSEISYCHSLDYFRTVTADGYLWDYWKKLADSIRYMSKSNVGSVVRSSSINRITIREIQPPALPSLPALPASNPSQYVKDHHHSNSVFSRFKRKSDDLDKKTCATLKVSGRESFVNTKDLKTHEEVVFSESTSISHCCQKSSNSETSTLPLIKSSNNKGIRGVVKKALKLKKKKEKIPS